MSLTYQDLELPIYRNTREIIDFNIEKKGEAQRCTLTLSDLVLAAELAGLNMLFISDTGRGKTQLVSDIYTAHFGGKGNWIVGRKDASVLDLFERTSADLTTGKFDSETARTLHEKRVAYLLNVADELNRAPGPVQADFFDLADGKYAFRGERALLGKEGYSLFLATMNLNKAGDNGFSGTFDVDRALYNRSHLTIDLDHSDFRPTAEDKLYIRSYAMDPRVKHAEKKDISAEILQAFHTIRTRSREPSLDAQIFAFLVDESLDYCEKDALKHEKQGSWPMACLDCPHSANICSSVKSSSERTVESIALLAQGLQYLAELKYGPVSISSFDAFLEAFRFTTYHGNLNDIAIGEKYAGRRQILMDETVHNLREIVTSIKPFMSKERLNTRLIECTIPERGSMTIEYQQDLLRSIEQKKIPHKVLDLPTILKEKGIGTNWIQSIKK